jgi:hypothetical protein
MLPWATIMDSTDIRQDQCAHACDVCALECDRTLLSDPSYSSSTGRFTAEHVALITCADVCRITAAAARDGRDKLPDVCHWCADVCDTFADSPRASYLWPEVAASCRECAEHCRAVAAALEY